MKNKQLITMSLALAITILALFGGVSQSNSLPTLDTFILYLAPEDFEPIVGDKVNVTCVFKNWLNETEQLFNVTLEFTADEELNITNFYDLDNSVADSYNYTDYMSNAALTDPLFWWDNNNVNATWKSIDQFQEEFFWFEVTCTTVGTFSFRDMTLSYVLNNETIIHDGDTFSLTVLDIPTTPSVPVPPRGELYWYWWLAGGAIIALPIIIIIITRLTLWKR